ncbi:MAG: GNAT family N-acetyltransferase [Chloroflexi bacterium]|nr:GNAT family N-acetyltransferase [Chloroflexota bacterium]
MPVPFLGNELLRGERVRLARLLDSDYALLARWTEDMENQRLLRRSMVYPSDERDMRDWLGKVDEYQFIPFGIRTLADDRLVGMLAIKDIFWQSRHCSFFINIGDAADQGQGYGSDAVKVMLKYCFWEMNMNRVGLEVMAYNEGARRTYEKIGFTPEGTLRQYVYRDGVYYDVHLMSLLRAEWDARYAEANRRKG